MSSPPSRTSLIVLLGSLTAFGPLSIDMYLPGMPAMGRDLGAPDGAVQLTLSSFFLGVTVAQLGYGPLADRYGRRVCLLAGLALYVVASIGCALAPTVESLIALRFVQALGGAAGMVVPRAMVRDLWSGRDSARVLSALMLVMGVAPVLAPSLGSAVVQLAGWRPVFGLLAGFGAIALVIAARGLPETLQAKPTSGSVFRRYLAVLRHRGFLGHTLAGGLGSAGMFAYIASSAIVLEKLYGLSTTVYAIVFAVNAIGYIGASQVNRHLLARHTPRELLDRALPVTVIAGAATLAIAIAGAGVVPLMIGVFAFVASLGLVNPNAVALALEDQAGQAGLASALYGTLQFSIGAVATAVMSAAGSASPVPMAATMAACALCAGLALRTVVGPGPAPAPVVG